MDYIVDVENKRLVSSFLSTRTSTPKSVIFGDDPNISVRLVESNAAGVDLPWRYVDLTGSSIRVAIGNPGGDPTSGTFTLTFSGDTTTALNYNATAAEVDTALNALASMVTAGGCTVSQVSAGYQVTFDSTGDQAIITATTDSLFPASSAYIYEATTGDGSTNEVQVVTLEVDNAAYVELTTDIAAPSATVTVVRDGVTDTTSELQRVEIDGDPYLGTWAITIGGNTSSAIAVDASLADITTAIEGITGIGAGNVTVTGSSLDFTIQFASSLGNVGTATIDVANLTGAIGKTGSIDLNTNQFLELLGGAASTTATLEIVKYNTGNSTSDTVFQGNITCKQDVIPDTPASATPFPTYAAASHTHTESDITDLGTATTLNADTSLVGNAWFLDDDTMAANDAEKVASQQSVKAYVDTQISGIGSVMEYKGAYDASADPSGTAETGDTYTVTVAGSGAASYWTTALEIGDVIIAETDSPSTEADWTVVNKDLDNASIKTAYEANADTNAFTDAEQTKIGHLTVTGAVNLDTINTDTTTNNAKLTADETNVTAAIDGATLTGVTVAGTDKVLVQDVDDSDNLKTVTAQSIADLSGAHTPEGTAILSTGETVGKLLQADGDNTCSWVAAPSGTPEGTAVLSTGETGGTKYLREDGDGTCSWQPAAGDVATDAIFDAAGDLVVGTGADTATRLALGANGLVLKSNGTTAIWDSIAGTGDVVGDASSTDNAVARFDGTTGKAIQNSSVTIDDSGNLTANNVSGTNTGDQDLSSLATKANVLELDNTTAFTPDADYEPATKKYVDDNIGSGGVSKVGTPVDNQVGVWTGDGTLEGDAGLTFDGDIIDVESSSQAAVRVDRTSGAVSAMFGSLYSGGIAIDSSHVFHIHKKSAADIRSGTSLSSYTGEPLMYLDPTTDTIGFNTDNLDTSYLLDVNGDIKLTGDIDVTGTIGVTIQTVSPLGSTTIDWGAGNFASLTFGASNETLTFTAPTKASDLVLKLVQDGTGSRTVTWPASVKWPGGTAPTLSTAGGAVDVIRFFHDGTNYYGTYDLNFS